MSRTVSIRRSLLVNILTMVLVLSLAIVVGAVLVGRRVGGELSAAIIRGTLDETRARLHEFFEPVVSTLHLAPLWQTAGLIDLDDTDRIDELLAPLLNRYPHISSYIVADATGREHTLIQTHDGWISRQLDPEQSGLVAHVRKWSDNDPVPVESTERIEYDPRERPWYLGALERRVAGVTDPLDLEFWTEPYLFFRTGEPGITASIALNAAGDGTDVVLAFDILLADITNYTTYLRPSPNGAAFVMTQAGQIIGLPRHEQFLDAERRRAAILTEAANIDIPVVRDGTAAYFRHDPDRRQAYRFRSGGQEWWGGCLDMTLGADRTLLIAVGVPSRDLLPDLQVLRVLVTLVAVVILAIAFWRAIVLARRYSTPVEALVSQSRRISSGNLDPGPPIATDVKEIRQLTRAHERMREGLSSLLKLERDLQIARQIQQRTLPERLPELPGFELAGWADPADETAGDTYDVAGYRVTDESGTVELTDERATGAFLMLADATGHGIGPAISVTQARSMLRMAALAAVGLEPAVRHLNEQLCADLPSGRFITAWLADLNAEKGTIISIAAGQGPVIYYEAASATCHARDADTFPFGVEPNLVIPPLDPICLSRGDLVAVFSDGIYEAPDGEGRLLGRDRVCALLQEHHEQSAERIAEVIREAVREHTGGAQPADDQTGLIIRCTK